MSPKNSRQIEHDGAIMKANRQMHDPPNSSSSKAALSLSSNGPQRGEVVATRSTASSSNAMSSLPPPTDGLRLPPPRFGGADGTRSLASSSTMSSVPPPVGTSTLQRATYLNAPPGAQRIPGEMYPNDDGTVVVGDGSVQGGVTPQSTLYYGITSATPVSQEPRSVPILTGTIPEADDEAPSAHVHRLNDAQHAHVENTVKAEPMSDEEKPSPFWKDMKTMCCVLVLILLAIGLGVGFAIGLNITSDDSSSVATILPIAANPPTPVATSPAPSSSPTHEFGRPNEATCETISEGRIVDGQESMIVRRFILDLDVIVVGQVSLDDVKFVLLQQEIAPEIAHCFDFRRKLEQSRNLLERFVVGNAIFETVVLAGSVCASVTTEDCFPIRSTLAFYLKDEESDSALISHILEIFDQGWEFAIPFESVLLTGTSLYTTGDISAPTTAPSHEEEDEHEDT